MIIKQIDISNQQELIKQIPDTDPRFNKQSIYSPMTNKQSTNQIDEITARLVRLGLQAKPMIETEVK